MDIQGIDYTKHLQGVLIIALLLSLALLVFYVRDTSDQARHNLCISNTQERIVEHQQWQIERLGHDGLGDLTRRLDCESSQ